MLRKAAFVLLLAALFSVSTLAQTPTQQNKVNIIIGRETIRFASQELAQEMRLVVTDQSGAELYDSHTLSLTTLDWLLRDNQGEPVKGGLYTDHQRRGGGDKATTRLSDHQPHGRR